jgi:hypothetical protein
VGGIYLASLSALLRSSTGYALACDGGDDKTSIKFFDIRVRLFVKGNVVNLHVCVLPESESATGLSMYKTLDTVMTAMDVLWQSKVIGISTDGVSAMTGWSAGLASRIVEAASSQCYRVWCMAHQFNLYVKAAGTAMSKPPVGGVPGFDFVGPSRLSSESSAASCICIPSRESAPGPWRCDGPRFACVLSRWPRMGGPTPVCLLLLLPLSEGSR